jgi:aspartate aminotransferase
MKQLSKRMSRLGTESAFAVLSKAQALEARGINVVHLEIGDPDFDTPRHICDAATEAMNKGLTHYSTSQGTVALRKEIAKHIGESHGLTIDPARVVVTPGAKPIIFFTILSLLEEGYEAIYPDPGFPIYESMINFAGARAVPVPLREELDFRLDVNELNSLITPRTKLIILNSPQNPTGGVLEESDLRAIAHIAREHDIYILSDEIYENISYAGKPASIASLPDMLDRTILLNGFSKTYAMTGWRAGYAVMPTELINPVVNLIVNSVSCSTTFVQSACIEALNGSQQSIHKMVSEFRARRDLLVEGLNSIPGISCRLPLGAFYAFPNIKKLRMSSSEIADYLLYNAGVATLAGSDFGKYGEGYIRLSYANSQENLKEAIHRIEKAVAKLK